MDKLSILMPAYNEEKTIHLILNKIRDCNVSLKKEIIIVDDGSRDNSYEVIQEYAKNNPELGIKVFKKENGGKGSAVKYAIKEATGDICIVQDADLEYDPCDYQACIDPILNGKTNVVYGSRRLKNNVQYSGLSFFLGGLLVTLVGNILFFKWITDEPTCYKTFKTDLIKKIPIEGNHFEWEPEVTAKLWRIGETILEVPINYYPRTVAEGKHINWKDGVEAVWTFLKWRFKSFKLIN
ncbi:glycosyltransferase family 2 protein [Candidatus Woesearchaeota archaeon]|jgi:dolichol-phosphate mannosyltransferase|nr:glycosyltransferase family 2 protein [Candidatus Woesearchaeota archaeon]MBT4387385.1 glycosyltransferase family 2 protein [Candidatus Woesearchaeota archaeon]MBT5740994.1 glycosyltransferase family 2 protein [Candidatus Woesearchaeota archaeon]MBT6505417.1 glycosyltransferase family 2 protein [Candidatus Woesearchaeota archaeon]MBT7849548.1 glycosyltransferase family 2 protein [Candidatus Woesearchaeota archaeon]